MNDPDGNVIIVLFVAIIIAFAGVVKYVRKINDTENVSREDKILIKPSTKKNEEEKFLYHLQKIEHNTSVIKWGIFVIVFLAFVLPIILMNL